MKRPATYQDLLALPEHLVGELLGGELHASPRPAPRHTLASSSLGGALYAPFQAGRGGPGGWLLLDEPELHLGADVLVPDIGGWHRDRMPIVPDDAYFTLAPDWVCEVLSPSTAALDRVKKMPVYAREGVSHVWLLDPGARTLEVFHLDGGRWTVSGTFTGTGEVRAGPFEGFGLELGLLWADSGAPNSP